MGTTLKGMRIYLIPTSYVNTGVDVGTTSTPVLDANPNRRYAAFFNDSDTTIYLAFGEAAIVGTGVRIPPDGVYEVTWNNPLTAEVNAIHGGSGTKRLTVIEAS